MKKELQSGYERRITRMGIPGFWHKVPTGENTKNYKVCRRLIASRTLRPINVEVTTIVKPVHGSPLVVTLEWGYPNKGQANSHRGPYKHVLYSDEADVITEKIDHPRRTIIYRSKGIK